MADLQHDLEVDRAAAFSILMAHGRGISSKSPDYMMEKWHGLQECRDQMEVVSFLDVFGQHIFFKWCDLWFKEHHTDNWPHEVVTIPTDTSASSPSNEDEKQEVLRYIPCDQGHGSNQYYYIQDDGTHLQRDSCTCGFFESVDCVLDLHRYHAGLGFTGESRLYI